MINRKHRTLFLIGGTLLLCALCITMPKTTAHATENATVKKTDAAETTAATGSTASGEATAATESSASGEATADTGTTASAGTAAATGATVTGEAAAATEATAAGEAADAAEADAASDNAKKEEAPTYFLILNKHTMLLPVGESSELAVTFYPPDVLSQTVTWETSDPEILTVTEAGQVQAIAPGYAYVTATTADGKYDTKCGIAVYPAGDLDAAAEEQTNWTKKIFYRSISHLQGRKSPWRSILCIGDSVTAGVQGGPGLLRWIPNYPLTMSALLNVPVFNHGVGGSSIWSGGNSAIINSVETFENTDAVFIMGGYNDWFYGTQCPIGDKETEGSFTYDFHKLCDKVKEVYPKADIFVILPPTPHEHVGVEPYYDFSWIRAIELEIAEEHGFYVINLPAEDVLNGLEEDTWRTFFSDGVHMNDYGYITLGTIVTDKALQIRQKKDADGEEAAADTAPAAEKADAASAETATQTTEPADAAAATPAAESADTAPAAAATQAAEPADAAAATPADTASAAAATPSAETAGTPAKVTH